MTTKEVTCLDCAGGGETGCEGTCDTCEDPCTYIVTCSGCDGTGTQEVEVEVEVDDE